jgi:hypothetical protein
MHKKLIARKLLHPKKKNLFDSGDFFLELEIEKKKIKKYFFRRWKGIYKNSNPTRN